MQGNSQRDLIFGLICNHLHTFFSMHILLQYCWEAILCGSPIFVLPVLWAETLAAFVPDYLFQDVCTATNFGRQTGSPSEARAGLFAIQHNKVSVPSGTKFEQGLPRASLKDWSSLNSGILRSAEDPACAWHPPPELFSSYKIETLSPLNSNLPFSPLPWLWQPPFYTTSLWIWLF